MVVAILQFELFMPQNQSLKDKRQLLQKLKEKVLAHFKIPVAEVGFQDLWQRSQLGVAIAGSEEKGLDALISKMVQFILAMGVGEVLREDRDFVHYE